MLHFKDLKNKINSLFEIGNRHLSGNDIEFFKRVWSQAPEIYFERLKAIEMLNLENILDAGCGFGQWSIVMALFNGHIDAIDCDTDRLTTLQEITKLLNIDNVKTHCGSIESLPFDDESFDAIFSYSAVYFTDVRQTLKEFARTLKPNARLYISTNGLGWYLHNLLDGHNESNHFDTKAMSIKSIEESLNYYSIDNHNTAQLITPSKFMKKLLHEYGLEIIDLKPDGKIILNKSTNPKSFYPENYYGLEGVYEIIAKKLLTN